MNLALTASIGTITFGSGAGTYKIQ